MKCVVIGDVFINEQIMKDSFEQYFKQNNIIKTFHFGIDDRKMMRDVVKKIEKDGFDSVDIPSGVLDEMDDADIIMVHLCPVTKDMLLKAKKLKVILCNRGGTENIDMQTAKDLNIPVLNNPAHNANAVAEYTIGQILCELRNISRSDKSLRENIWRETYPNSSNIKELKKMTVGIIGYGAVGKLVSEKLSGFNCKILIYDPYININEIINNSEYVSLEYLLKNSDIVTLHARSNDKDPILNEQLLNMMKEDAYLINNARSHLIDNDSLYNLLENKKIMGAAIDVFDIEPLDKDNKFLKLDNVTLTNHRAGDTLNSYNDSPLMLIEKLNNLNILD